MDDAVAIFEALEADPTRAALAARKQEYRDGVREPLEALLDALGGSWRIYRPWGDARFGGPEIKDFAGAVREDPDGLGAFVKIDARGLFAATGMPMLARDQLARYRSALADPVAAAAFVDAIDDARVAGRSVTGGRWEPLKRLPREAAGATGVAADLARWKGVELPDRIGVVPWNQAPSLVTASLEATPAVHAWLRERVGPSALTAEERFAPRRR